MKTKPLYTINTRLKKALLFTSCTLLVLWGIQAAIEQAYISVSKQKFNLLLSHKHQADIMIFGSSTAYNHINPFDIQRETGYTCYNEGLHAMFFPQYKALINDYLSYQSGTKCIVVSVDMESLSERNELAHLDYFLPYLGRPSIYDAFVQIEPQKMILARYLPGYRLTLMDKKFYRMFLFPDRSASRRRGYSPLHTEWLGDLTKVPDTVAISQKVYKDWQQVVGAISAKGANTIIVIPPLQREGRSKIKNADRICQAYRSLGDNKKVFVLDYSFDTLCNNKSYFSNYSHLNVKGATLFSRQLSVDIARITGTKPGNHRSK